MRPFFIVGLIAGSLCLAFLSIDPTASRAAEGWNQFRGPQGGVIATDIRLPKRWSGEGDIRWQADLPGEGWAAPVVVQGRVPVVTAVSDGGKNRDSIHRWQVLCFDQQSGEPLWTQTAKVAKPTQSTHRDNTYASETPVTDGERIIVYFGNTGLFCYDIDGNELWNRDLGSFPMRNQWGTSSSPVIIDQTVFIQVDNEQRSFVVALDSRSGEEIWRVDRDEPSNWGSPLIWQNALRTELVTSGKRVRSYDPATGELLWKLEARASGVNSTPTGSAELLIVGHVGRNGGGMFAVKAGASGDITLPDGESANESVIWSSDEGPRRASPLIYGGYVYLLSSRGGIVTCLDAQTGDVAYQSRIPGAGEFWASPWAYDGQVFCPDAAGKTFVIEPGPQLKLVATNPLPVGREDQIWASAAAGDGALLIRSTAKLYAIGEGSE